VSGGEGHLPRLRRMAGGPVGLAAGRLAEPPLL